MTGKLLSILSICFFVFAIYSISISPPSILGYLLAAFLFFVIISLFVSLLDES